MTTFRNEAELAAEVSDRLWRRGIRPCACGADCTAYRQAWQKVQAGLLNAADGNTEAAGHATAARLGYHPDGRSRAMTHLSRLGVLARSAKQQGRRKAQ